MAICPFAVQQIIPESNQQGRITPTTLIYHEAVSSADSLRDYWNTPGNELESHFYIGSTGTIYQFVDTNVRADANMNANAFAISVETWDDSNRNPLLGWNPAMLAAAKRLAAWVCDTHGIKRGPATTWNGGGIGGHNWFPDPWAGGPRQCPGVTRNAQIRNEIIPYVANGGTAAEEDDLSAEDTEMLRQILNQLTGSREVNKFPGYPHRRYGKTAGSFTLVDYLREIDRQVNSNLDLKGRPGPETDDLLGHVLSMRADQKAATVELTDEQAEQINTQVGAIVSTKLDEVVDQVEGLSKEDMRDVLREFRWVPQLGSSTNPGGGL